MDEIGRIGLVKVPDIVGDEISMGGRRRNPQFVFLRNFAKRNPVSFKGKELSRNLLLKCLNLNINLRRFLWRIEMFEEKKKLKSN
jgi:hypothetical protein